MDSHQTEDKKLQKDRQSGSDLQSPLTTSLTDHAIARQALTNDRRIRPTDVMQLQRLIGNRATQKHVVQRVEGDKKPYKLKDGSAAGLKEEQFVTGIDPAVGVQFTAFTSCIGVVGIKGDKMVAAHLVMRGTEDTPVDPASVSAVFDGATNMMVFGHIEAWSAESNGSPMAALYGSFSEVEDWESKGDGTYKVTRDGDSWNIAG